MNATALVSDLQARGVRLEPQGDKLRVVAPRGTLTPELRALLASQKADILAVLQGRCTPTCLRCAAGSVQLPDGCESHHITPEQTARWWALAQEMNAVVSWCHCCAGPSPDQALVCRRCEEVPA